MLTEREQAILEEIHRARGRMVENLRLVFGDEVTGDLERLQSAGLIELRHVPMPSPSEPLPYYGLTATGEQALQGT